MASIATHANVKLDGQGNFVMSILMIVYPTNVNMKASVLIKSMLMNANANKDGKVYIVKQTLMIVQTTNVKMENALTF